MDNTKIIPFELEYDAQQVKANPFQFLITFKKNAHFSQFSTLSLISLPCS